MTAIPKREDTPPQETKATMSDAERRQAAIALLQSWQDADEEDAQEQHETYEFLVKSLKRQSTAGTAPTNMSLTIILDTGPLGKVSNPKDTLENNAATDWLKAHIASGNRIIVPEIANYELRRELLLGNKMRGLQKLDDLLVFLEYLPLKTAAIYEAAHCWAEARKKGKPTAHPHALDGDMLLVAQVRLLNDPTAVVATVDVGDLPQFVPAKLWSDIV